MGKKCQAVNCRSGYDLTKQDKAVEEEGEVPEPKKYTVRVFPANEENRQKWVKTLRREDSVDTKHGGVCDKHFKPEDFEDTQVKKTGADRKRRRLKPTSVPSLFPNYPGYYAQVPVAQPRPTQAAISEVRHQRTVELLQQQEVELMAKDSVNDFADLWEKMRRPGFCIDHGFRFEIKRAPGENNHQFICFTIDKLNADDVPQVDFCVNVYQDLTFKAFASGISVKPKRFKEYTAKFGTIGKVSELENVLAHLKDTEVEPQDTLTHCTDLLKQLNVQELDDEVRLVTIFCTEQLNLVQKHPNARRYSSFLMGQCAMWDRMSPKLYKHLYNASLMVLPHPNTCREKLSALNVTEGFSPVTRKYFEMRIKKLSEREKLVHLSMDEVHTSETLELTAGTFFGETAGQTTKKIFATHISSIAGNYQDLVSMNPVHTTNAKFINKVFNKVNEEITNIGYTVVSVSTDNHRSNQAWHNSLIEGVTDHPMHIGNPAKLAQRLYTFYDTTHIFKNMYYCLLNRKVLKFKNFPWVSDRNTPVTCNGKDTMHTVKLDHFKKIVTKEFGHPAKMGYKLTDKVLNPSNIERQSVSLAAAATDATTTAALRFVAEKTMNPEYDDTADFLDAIRKWFTIVNVKSVNADRRFNDENRKRIEEDCQISQSNLEYICNFGRYLKDVSDDKSVPADKKMTRDTTMAVFHTSQGLKLMVNYVLENYKEEPWGIKYLLLGKFQSDMLESHFGHIRKLAGSNYWTSVRNFLQGEAIIRKHALLWYSGYGIKEVQQEMSGARQAMRQEDQQVIDSFVKSLVAADTGEEDAYEPPDHAKPALGHIAGYLGYQATKKKDCDDCINLLVDKEAGVKDPVFDADEVDEEYLWMTNTLNRGGLKAPTELAVSLTVDVSQVWRHIVGDPDRRARFLACDGALKVFQAVVIKFVRDYHGGQNEACDSGHLLVEELLPFMTESLFNCFGSNLAKDTMSEIHKKSKKTGRDVSQEERRHRETRKRQKLQSDKE